MTRKSTLDDFIEKAREVHATGARGTEGDRNDYSKFIYVNSKTKGIIICKIHGEFLQSPSHHLQGKGCSKCGVKKSKKKREFKRQGVA